MRLTGLALCVMNGPVTDADRFVFNTCGCTMRSASRDKPVAFVYLFIYLISSQKISVSLRLLAPVVDVVTKLQHQRHKLWHFESVQGRAVAGKSWK